MIYNNLMKQSSKNSNLPKNDILNTIRKMMCVTDFESKDANEIFTMISVLPKDTPLENLFHSSNNFLSTQWASYLQSILINNIYSKNIKKSELLQEKLKIDNAVISWSNTSLNRLLLENYKPKNFQKIVEILDVTEKSITSSSQVCLEINHLFNVFEKILIHQYTAPLYQNLLLKLRHLNKMRFEKIVDEKIKYCESIIFSEISFQNKFPKKLLIAFKTINTTSIMNQQSLPPQSPSFKDWNQELKDLDFINCAMTMKQRKCVKNLINTTKNLISTSGKNSVFCPNILATISSAQLSRATKNINKECKAEKLKSFRKI